MVKEIQKLLLEYEFKLKKEELTDFVSHTEKIKAIKKYIKILGNMKED